MDPESCQQRRSGNLAVISEIRASPGQSCRHCPGQTPRNCGVSAACVHGLRFAEKRVVVDAVSSEPVSGEFPDKQGKNREFSQNHPIIRPVDASNTLVLWVFWLNSLNNGTGNIFGGTGNLIRETGNYLGTSGNRPTVRRSVQIRGTQPPQIAVRDSCLNPARILGKYGGLKGGFIVLRLRKPRCCRPIP